MNDLVDKDPETPKVKKSVTRKDTEIKLVDQKIEVDKRPTLLAQVGGFIEEQVGLEESEWWETKDAERVFHDLEDYKLNKSETPVFTYCDDELPPLRQTKPQEARLPLI